MNQTVLNEQKQFRSKTLITVLAIVAMALLAFCCLSFCVTYEPDGNIWEWEYELVFRMPETVEFLYIMQILTPCVLFALYVLTFYKRVSTRVILPIIFGLFAVPAIPMLYHLFNETLYFYDDQELLLEILKRSSFAAAAVMAAIGVLKKIPAIVASCVGLTTVLINLSTGVDYLEFLMEDEMTFMFLACIAEYLGSTIFYVALLLFGLKYQETAPKAAPRPVVQQPVMVMQQPVMQQPVMVMQQPVVQQPAQQPVMYVQQPAPQQPANAAAGTPEQALLQLKQLYTSGLITEEEYAAKRNEIISRL